MSVDDPNFLFVSIDSLRPDFCSFMSGTAETTPFLSRLANRPDATVFEYAISPSTWTLQVHGSIFTGLYPPEHGVLDKGRTLGAQPTLAELLGTVGYDAFSYGRNGWLESGEILRGFNHHHTRYSQHITQELGRTIEHVRDGRWRDAANTAKWTTLAAIEKARKRVFRQIIEDELTINAAVDGVTGRDGPFCCFVHLNGAHYVYRPRAPNHRRFGDHSLRELAANTSYQRDMIQQRPAIYAGEYEFDHDQEEITKDLYRGTIYQTDALVQRLVNAIDADGILENTVLVVFGDHGDHLGDDGHFGHQFSVDDALIRVPLLVIDPTDSIPTDRASDVVQLNDLYPTALSIADVDAPPTRSVDLTTDGRESAYVYYEAPESVIDRFESQTSVSSSRLPPARQYAVWKSPDDKYVWNPDGSRDAPAEDAELAADLYEHFDTLERVQAGNDDEISDEVEANLKRMGYL